jgi:hypothetical protein
MSIAESQTTSCGHILGPRREVWLVLGFAIGKLLANIRHFIPYAVRFAVNGMAACIFRKRGFEWYILRLFIHSRHRFIARNYLLTDTRTLKTCQE